MCQEASPGDGPPVAMSADKLAPASHSQERRCTPFRMGSFQVCRKDADMSAGGTGGGASFLARTPASFYWSLEIASPLSGLAMTK